MNSVERAVPNHMRNMERCRALLEPHHAANDNRPQGARKNTKEFKRVSMHAYRYVCAI